MFYLDKDHGDTVNHYYITMEYPPGWRRSLYAVSVDMDVIYAYHSHDISLFPVMANNCPWNKDPRKHPVWLSNVSAK